MSPRFFTLLISSLHRPWTYEDEKSKQKGSLSPSFKSQKNEQGFFLYYPKLFNEMSQLPYKCGNADTVECLYGVYLLYSLNPKYKGRTYIGYTVNPKRRLNQHNKGQLFGGARRTNNRGPWEMVLLVHGFPNDISALRFEWAWQHPERSRRLQTIEKKKRKETHYVYRLRVLQLMLNMGPWSKLPLTVRWLADQYQPNSKVDLYPPTHMPIAAGPVYPRKPESKNTSVFTPTNCSLCSTTVSSEDRVSCVVPCCDLVAHIRCLAGHFIKESEDLLPVEGICPACKFSVLWGDIVRSKILNSL